MRTTDNPVLDMLSLADCRELLTSVPIGRLAFTMGALPTIQPMHFSLRGEDLLIPAPRGGNVEAATRGAVVAFEVDEYDAFAGTGWSVTVVGPSRVLTNAAEVAALRSSALADWAPAPEVCVVAVRISRISGRRLSRRSPSDRDRDAVRPVQPAHRPITP